MTNMTMTMLTAEIFRASWANGDNCRPSGVKYGDVWHVVVPGLPLHLDYFQVVDALSGADWIPTDVREFIRDTYTHVERIDGSESATWKFWNKEA